MRRLKQAHDSGCPLWTSFPQDLKLEEAWDVASTDEERGELQEQMLGVWTEGGKRQQTFTLSAWRNHDESAEESRLEALETRTRALCSLEMLIHLLIGYGMLMSAVLGYERG